ncbi:MAG TPA: dTMP kinase [Burkholderiales bacterium]|jgi:dTMP kinase|nr:dTMP kinase [Burkholderiales bacterium]
MRGKFITLEGIDGAGKSTHVAWLADRLQRGGREVVVTREPGGTPLGEKLRALLLNEAMEIGTETLLMFAARQEHVAKVIRPALDRGAWVLSDRFTDATFAYQGAGRGFPAARLEALESWVQDGLQPDRTFFFDVPVDVGQNRLKSAQAGLDRFEGEARAFHERVRAAYLERAARYPARFLVVDSTQPIEGIRKALEDAIASI